jgi:hypothetical protein
MGVVHVWKIPNDGYRNVLREKCKRSHGDGGVGGVLLFCFLSILRFFEWLVKGDGTH